MLRLKIVSPERVEFDGEVESVLVPGTLGSFEILQDHAPIISSLDNHRQWYRNGIPIYRRDMPIIRVLNMPKQDTLQIKPLFLSLAR